jgi:hypothetical protein
MIAYKLVRKMKDGSLAPLFINAKSRMKVGEWMPAEDHPTKGFAYRPGWHCTLKPEAPHLAENPKGGAPRVWVKVEIRDYKTYDRPESQGGTWVLAQEMKILGELSSSSQEPEVKIVSRDEEYYWNSMTAHFERFVD